jgi:predicted flap endonuclease-1-like 5' DNA nuclease
MYLISQTMIYLLLAIIIGGAIGYAFRACLADTACDDVRDDLALAQQRLQAMEDSQRVISVPIANDLGIAPFPKQMPVTPPVAVVAEPAMPVANTIQPLPIAPEMGGPHKVAVSLSELSARDMEIALLDAAPGTSPKSRFEADDLTAIKGLTPQMDTWLGNLGITRLADIASLTSPELYWLVENLPGDGSSVYRDHWIAQATAMLAKR